MTLANADSRQTEDRARAEPTTLAFAIAAATFLAVMAGTTLPTPLYPIYQQVAHFHPFVLTLIFAVYACGVIASLIVAGPWSDQIGRKPMLLGAMILALFSDALFMQGTSLWTILPGRVLSGLSAGIFAATATVTVMELAPKGQQAKSSLVATGANIIGLGCGPVLSGLAASLLPAPLFLPFVIHAVTTALLLLLLFFFVPETVRRTGNAGLAIRKLSVSKEAEPVFKPAAIAAFASFMLAGFVTSVGPSYLAQNLGIQNHAIVGFVAGLLFLASAIGQMGDQLLPKATRLIFGALLLFAGLVVLVLSLVANAFWLLVVGIAIGGLGFGIAFHSGLSALADASPDNRSAETVATYFTIAYVAISLPVLGIGAIQSLAGLRATSIGFAILAILVVAIAIFQLRRLSDSSR